MGGACLMQFTLTVLALSAALTGFMPAFVSAEQDYDTAMIKAPEKEVHGVWLTYEDYGKLGLTIQDGEDAYREAAENFLSDMDTCGINTVFLHERAFDDAFWKSPTFHASRYLGADESLTAEEAYPFDPAGIFLEEAHERGISVHAWLNPYRVSRSYYYDPAEDSTTERVLTAVRELMEFESGGETFDGIHLDDYFYHAASGYISVSDPGHPHPAGASAEQKRNNINRMVRQVYETVHAYGRKFGISPAGNYQNDMNSGADIDTWLSEDGYIDYLIPQIYWTNHFGSNGSIPKFTETLELFLSKRWNNVRIYAGLALYRGGSRNHGDIGWSISNTNICEQVIEAEESGCNGYAIYCASSFYEPAAAEELNQFLAGAGEKW